MHRVMAVSTVVMNAAGVCVAILFAIAARDMPEFALNSGAVYAGVLLVASFASERIRAHVLHADAENSPSSCVSTARISRALLLTAWVAMAGVLGYLVITQRL